MTLASPPLSEPVVRKAAPLPGGPRALVVVRWPVGGIRTHLSCNYPFLSNRGFRCTFILPDDDSMPAMRAALCGLPGSEVIGVPVQGRDCSLWQTVRPLLRSGRFALAHAHGLTAAAHAIFASLGSDTPLLVTLHEPLRREQFLGLVGTCKRWLLGRGLARAEAIVTVSQDSRDNLLRWFPNLRKHTDRIHAISNGIDMERFADSDFGRAVRVNALSSEGEADLRHELGIAEDTTLIGFLGRFMPEKGFHLLLEAARRLVAHGGVPSFHVVAFGSGDYRREHQKQIESLGLTRHITLRDFVPCVAGVLRHLDLVVVPSLWEASSLVSMEAMAAGVPVLGSDCPGLREVLRGTPSRTFKTGEVASLECGLREALADLWTDEARDFAGAARERFDNQRSARRLGELYAALACSPLPAGERGWG